MPMSDAKVCSFPHSATLLAVRSHSFLRLIAEGAHQLRASGLPIMAAQLGDCKCYRQGGCGESRRFSYHLHWAQASSGREQL